jgi:hypothetical protein
VLIDGSSDPAGGSAGFLNACRHKFIQNKTKQILQWKEDLS